MHAIERPPRNRRRVDAGVSPATHPIRNSEVHRIVTLGNPNRIFATLVDFLGMRKHDARNIGENGGQPSDMCAMDRLSGSANKWGGKR